MAKKEVKNNKDKTSFTKSFKAELKKVIWPTPKQLFNNTVGVIAFVVIFALIVFILDVCFDCVNKYGIVKLQEKVQTSFSTNTSENNAGESNTSEDNDISEGDTTVDVNSESSEEQKSENEQDNSKEDSSEEQSKVNE